MNVFLVFPCVFGFPPAASAQGKQPLRKDLQEVLYPLAWKRRSQMRGSKPSLGKKKPPTSVCVQAFIWKDHVSFFNGRAPDLLRSPILHSRSQDSALPFASLAKTFLASSVTAQEGVGCGMCET